MFGDNNIFDMAKEAADKTETVTFEERLGMVYTDAVIKKGKNGKLTPEEYFEILKNHGIISDLTVPGGNIAEPTENEDGSKTYRITSDDDYIFEATIYPDGKVETEVIEKGGNEVTPVLVTSVKLNKPTMKIDEGKSETLTVTVEPKNAKNKAVEWTAKPESIATVDQNGKVTGVAIGEATITATAKDGSGEVASCIVTVQEAESNWLKISEMAAKIAKGEATDAKGTIEVNGVDKEVSSKKVTIDGKEETITVGEIFKVRYTESENSSTFLKVRVLGFNHDTLAQATDYGAVGSKAGISFEFIEFVGSPHRMHSEDNNSVGWKGSEMRAYLNEGFPKTDTEPATPALITKLSNARYIKTVTKPYLLGTSATTANTDCSDKLWLLSCSEIWANGRGSGAKYGYAKAKEGEQYEYYQVVSPNGSTSDTNRYLQKKVHNGSTSDWWLRSPFCVDERPFCDVHTDGGSNRHFASYGGYVAPGFSI